MKRILLIGATSAIAEAVARLWAEQGHSLFLATRQILEDLGKDLLERAAKMPAKPG